MIISETLRPLLIISLAISNAKFPPAEYPNKIYGPFFVYLLYALYTFLFYHLLQ